MTTRTLMLAAAVAVASSSSAFAKSEASSAPVNPIRVSRTLAGDIQVVNPAPSPSPNPQPPPAAVMPVAPPAQPVVAAPGSQKVIHEDVQPTHNYMATVAVSALMGGLLVGGAIYYLGDQTHPRNIGFWTAGGVLAGTAIGVAQVIVQEDRADRAVGYADPVPTYRLALVNARF